MNTFNSLVATLLFAFFLTPVSAHAQLTIGRQPQADGRRSSRQPASQNISTMKATVPKAQSSTDSPDQILTLLDELDEAYANHAILMQNVLTQVPASARNGIQSAIQSAEQSRRMIAVRRKQLVQTSPRINPIRGTAPTAAATPVPDANANANPTRNPASPLNGKAAIAKPGLQMKRDARQKAAMEYQKAMEKRPLRKVRTLEMPK